MKPEVNITGMQGSNFVETTLLLPLKEARIGVCHLSILKNCLRTRNKPLQIFIVDIYYTVAKNLFPRTM